VTRQSIPFPAKRSHEVHGFAARKSGTDVLTSKNKRLLHLPKTVMNLAATTWSRLTISVWHTSKVYISNNWRDVY